MPEAKSFAPIINQQSTLLILGSMPGMESLRLNQYYANPRNHFWQILYKVFDAEPGDIRDYQEKISFALGKGIALWDVIQSCRREGSLDTAIQDEVVNEFGRLFSQYPGIRYVFFNGAKAYETFRKKVGMNAFPCLIYKKLPSSSPAHTISLEKKLKEWSILKDPSGRLNQGGM